MRLRGCFYFLLFFDSLVRWQGIMVVRELQWNAKIICERKYIFEIYFYFYQKGY
jgi:hypothetical protein